MSQVIMVGAELVVLGAFAAGLVAKRRTVARLVAARH
jgi:hypothetical protein